jgi:malic enzyme
MEGKGVLFKRFADVDVFDIEVNGSPLHKEADDRANQRILEEIFLR